MSNPSSLCYSVREPTGTHERELREARRRARNAVKDFVEGAASGDVRRIFSALSDLDYAEHDGGGWRRALRRVAQLPMVPAGTRAAFRALYLEHGDNIRQGTGDDLVLAAGLRVLLPPYTGKSRRLFRGETAYNWKRRMYGASWTADIAVARSFAMTGYCRTARGGSVLLSVLAPASAIIHAVEADADRFAEHEFMIDRRGLPRVEVVRRYPQLSADALRRCTTD